MHSKRINHLASPTPRIREVRLAELAKNLSQVRQSDLEENLGMHQEMCGAIYHHSYFKTFNQYFPPYVEKSKYGSYLRRRTSNKFPGTDEHM
jgi:single-stranded DNA-specific DHH superfamily exonuclease